MYVCMYVFMYVCIYLCMYVYECMYVCMYVCIYVFMNVHAAHICCVSQAQQVLPPSQLHITGVTRTRTHTRTHTHTHAHNTNTHSNTQTRIRSCPPHNYKFRLQRAAPGECVCNAGSTGGVVTTCCRCSHYLVGVFTDSNLEVA